MGAKKRSSAETICFTYEILLDQQNLALGAYIRVNIGHQSTGKRLITPQEALQAGTSFTSKIPGGFDHPQPILDS